MQIDNKYLLHLNEYFSGYDCRLCCNPEITRGMYFVARKLNIIYYDCRFIYLRQEVQFMIIAHALLMYNLLGTAMPTINVMENADRPAVERAHKQFPELPKTFFVGIIADHLLKHNASFDTERLTRLKKYIDHDFTTKRKGHAGKPNGVIADSKDQRY